MSEKDCNDFDLLSYKQSVEEVLILRAVTTTIQIPQDKSLFDNYGCADETLKVSLFTETRRPGLEESK